MNLATALQQLGYITLIAFGAWLVTENRLTMGGLLACAIISGRIMTPIAQLPGIMVQWAHARAALDELDKIIALPSEQDEKSQALIPQTLEGSYRFERTRFTYGIANQLALEINQLINWRWKSISSTSSRGRKSAFLAASVPAKVPC